MNQYYRQYQPYTGAIGQQGAQPIAGGAPQPVPGQQGFTPLPGMVPGAQGTPPSASSVPGMLPIEQSYIENILRLNKGKLVHLFATFEGSTSWNSKEFTGVIEAAGRDHVILSDPQAGTRYLIPMVAVDYITFAEEIEYEYPLGGGPALGTYAPR